MILTSLVLVAVAIISATFLMTFVNSEEYVQLNLDNLNHAKINLSVFASNGEPFEEPFSIGKSKQIDFDRIPQHTKNAFVAVEDKRFYSHKGIDWIRVGGAVLSNVKSMSFSEGASTITQQLIKNTHLNHNKTLKRKFNEMLLASQLEKEFTKDQILETYLNTIYFGNGAVGIENASNTYFGKSAYDLTLEESATLAGIIKAPTTYSPKNNVEKCTKRRNLVLDLMEQNGYINQKDCQKAKNTPIVLCQTKKISYENDYLEEVIKEAMEVLAVDEKQLYNSNFSIYTYFDKDIQRNLTDTIASCSYETNSLIIKNKNIVALNKAGNFHQKRQAGSALKPLAVYTPSLNEKLINVVSSVMDERVNYNGYSPKNANDKYVGWTTIENSVANSINTTAVKLLNSLTVAKSCQYLNKLGIETADENLSLALGNANKGLNVVDLGAGYSTLANNGQYQKPKTIEKIEKDGFTVYRNKEKEVKVFNDSSAF
ncbi:MAG: transglycosylase domain-containing protein [Clostridia bacterium]|nr:transglycosylase domain-containing protein [Clostridia bacterium]